MLGSVRIRASSPGLFLSDEMLDLRDGQVVEVVLKAHR
jgi:hypothetical protein